MYKVKIIKNIGTWAKAGEIRDFADYRAERHLKLGDVEILEYLGSGNDNPYGWNLAIKYREEQIKALKHQIQYYKIKLKQSKRSR